MQNLNIERLLFSWELAVGCLHIETAFCGKLHELLESLMDQMYFLVAFIRPHIK